MTTPQEARAISRLRAKGLVRMAPTGSWEPTERARDLLAELDVLLALMGRPGPSAPSAPRRRAQTRRKTGTATPPNKGAVGRDDDPGRTRGSAPKA